MKIAMGKQDCRFGLRLQLLFVAATVVLHLGPSVAHADLPIESQYGTAPSVAVTWNDGRPAGCSAPAGTPPGTYTFVHPTNLGPAGTLHPLVIWANGTDVPEILGFGGGYKTTCYYQSWLQHLARWGFVVLAINGGQTGSGHQMVFGELYLASLNDDPSSIFYHRLDTGHVAAAGHSQGALGAINAAILVDGVFQTVLAMSTPDRGWMTYYNSTLCNPPNCVDVPVPERSALGEIGVPMFLVWGANDPLANYTALDWFQPAPAPFAAAARVGANHINLSTAFGYMSAWLRYMLVPSDTTARAAFAGTAPEILSNANWTSDTAGLPIALQNLP